MRSPEIRLPSVSYFSPLKVAVTKQQQQRTQKLSGDRNLTEVGLGHNPSLLGRITGSLHRLHHIPSQGLSSCPEKGRLEETHGGQNCRTGGLGLRGSTRAPTESHVESRKPPGGGHTDPTNSSRPRVYKSQSGALVQFSTVLGTSLLGTPNL